VNDPTSEPLKEENRLLREQLAQARGMIRILWEVGTFTQSVGNALSEDGVLRAALHE
jgi:hypothetical protein